MANWHLDDGHHLDAEDAIQIEVVADFSIESAYTANPFTLREIPVRVELDADVQHLVPLDLLPLVPEKFRSSVLLQTWIREAGIQFGSMLTSVRDIVLLLNPNTVSSTEYIRQLGALIGVEFPPGDSSTTAEVRKTLSQAVEWYKLKGTYTSMDLIAQIFGFTVNLYDMYTNDYSTFVLTDWFVGGENENPPGLDSTYYKSPHFGAEVVLNQVYEPSGTSLRYIWKTGYLDNFMIQVENTRPVHTVPHYFLLLNPITDEFGHLIETTGGEIKAKVTSAWQYGAKYFDLTGSGDIWSFDTGTMEFDTSATAFMKSITKWVLGTGNYPCHLNDSTVEIENPVLTGTIDPSDITEYDDYFQFEFIVPASTVQLGLSELGLYIPGTPDTLVLASCFPKLDKESGIELHAVVQVYKNDLSV